MKPVLKTRGIGTEEINLSKIWDLFIKRWYYVLVTLAISVSMCWLYLRYTKPLYLASATVRVEEKQGPGQGLGLMEAFGFSPLRDNIQSEIQFLRSRSIVTKALQEMDLNCAYYLVGTLVTAEMYKDDTPFLILYDTSSQVLYNQMFSLFYEGGNKYRLSYNQGQTPVESVHYFGEKVDVEGFEFHVIKRETPRYRLMPGIEYKWQPIRWKSLVGRAMGGLNVEQSGYLVPILKISHTDHVAKFAMDFINTLVEVYQKEDQSRKTEGATQALNFIQEQVKNIRDSVDIVEDSLQFFKENKAFINVELKVGFEMESMKRAEELLNGQEVKLMEISRLQNDVASGNKELSLPYSIEGQTDPILSSLISSYNGLVQERLAALASYTSTHPKVIELTDKQAELRESIVENISSIKKSTEERIAYYERSLVRSKDSLKVIPEMQREYQGMMREYEVKEKILSTLLEKQAEAQIAKASIVSSVYILDRALLPRAPISPLPQKVYIIGVGLGICAGLLLILLSGMLKNTVSYREEIENSSVTPIIGVVRRSSESLRQKYPLLMSVEHPKSSLSESIRSIRTNLQFISSDKKSKIVSITSTVSGEGKSFITINLAGIISLLNVKVVILDMDLRKPKLHFSFGQDNSAGLSTFLVGKNSLDEILKKTQYKNLDIITSGPIPPNPAELIMSKRMTDLLDELRGRYDYILIDTPPIGLVTDGTSILKMSDIALYVIRADYSKKSFAQNPDQLVEDHNIRNLYIILNSVSAANRRYGGYGYKIYGSGYYSDDKKPSVSWKFWKKLRKR